MVSLPAPRAGRHCRSRRDGVISVAAALEPIIARAGLNVSLPSADVDVVSGVGRRYVNRAVRKSRHAGPIETAVAEPAR